MVSDNQVQKAGDGATQFQANSITVINSGITEERARAIFAEQILLARKEYTEEAYHIADERINKFEEHLMPRIKQVENALPSFADPAFLVLLRRSQQSAAVTEREADYDLLTELLICHVQKGNERKTRSAINRAVEIVGEIDNDALCGLTAAYALRTFWPVAGSTTEGLTVFDGVFSKLLYRELPTGHEWLDHLDVLGAIRLSSFSNSKKLSGFIPSSWDGYTCVGILKESEEYKKAIDLLNSVEISRDFLVPNECLDGYFRLEVARYQLIDELSFSGKKSFVPLNSEQKNALKRIWEMYSQDAELKKQAEKRFVELWDTFEYLHQLRLWWDAIPQTFTITQVGRVLAQINATRCDPIIPNML